MYPGLTKTLDVNCTFTKHSDISTIRSIILSKTQSLQSGVYSQLASITAASGNQLVVKDSLGAQVAGKLVASGTSFIAYQWVYPTDVVCGTFQCEAFAMDNLGHPRIKSADVEVRETRVDVDMILDKMAAMEHRLDDQDQQLSQLTQHINDSRETISQYTSQFNNHTYVISHETEANFMVANTYCRLVGGYLVEVNDQAELDFLSNFLQDNLSLYKRSAMVAGTDWGHEGNWTFPSNDDFVYLDWADRKPAGTTYLNCILFVVERGMVDDYCYATETRRFVCEFEF